MICDNWKRTERDFNSLQRLSPKIHTWHTKKWEEVYKLKPTPPPVVNIKHLFSFLCLFLKVPTAISVLYLPVPPFSLLKVAWENGRMKIHLTRGPFRLFWQNVSPRHPPSSRHWNCNFMSLCVILSSASSQYFNFSVSVSLKRREAKINMLSFCSRGRTSEGHSVRSCGDTYQKGQTEMVWTYPDSRGGTVDI